MRVIEISDELGGIAGEVLASFGADVQRVLLPGQAADPVRDSGKSTVAWAGALRDTLADVDILIDGLGPGGLEARDADAEATIAAHPTLVVAQVSWFGHDGPYAGFAGSEIIAQAMGGTLNICGPALGVPTLEPEDAARFHAELALVTGSLAAHRIVRRGGLGQTVDVSVHEASASRLHRIAYQFDGIEDRRGILDASIWRLADGFASLTLSPGALGFAGIQALVIWMREAGFDAGLLGERAADWKSVQYRELRDGGLEAALRPLIAQFLASQTKAEFHRRTVTEGVQGAVIRTPADVLADEHLAARHFWEELEGLPAPSRYASITPAGHVPPAEPAPVSDLPLAGVRVLDFCWAIAGSGTTVQLAQLGAEVVRVESATRPDLARTEVQASVSTPDSFDDKPWAANLNISKKSIRLDLRHPDSREVLARLVEWADVITENFRPGTLARLGWSDERFRELNPGVIIAKGSMAGQSGPLAHLWGIDTTGRALSGRVHLTGRPEDPPVSGVGTPAPYGDVVVPYVKAAAIIHALDLREQTGQVSDIDVSMLEVLAQQVAPALYSAARGGSPDRRGNRSAHAVQGVYPVQGEDRWIALTIAGDNEWADFVRASGIASLKDPALGDAAARLAAHDVIDEAIAAWTRTQDGRALMLRLQSAGIRAGLVQTTGEVSDADPQLQHRAFLTDIDHPVLGAFGHSTLPYAFSRTEVVRRPAPALGQDGRDVMTRIVGLSDDEFEEMERAGVFR